MSQKTISRRQFLRLSALSSGALVLAACGGNAPNPDPTAEPPADAAASLYLFDGDQPPVLDASPGDEENFTSLFHLKNVTVNDGSLSLDSAETIEAAVAGGQASIEERNIFVNCPVPVLADNTFAA